MAELVVTQDELALRRRARRRLVGAVAIALTVVLVLPMLFDSEPKPLGPDVDIRIPAQDSPFDTAPPLAPAIPIVPPNTAPTQPAEPTQASTPSATLANTSTANSTSSSVSTISPSPGGSKPAEPQQPVEPKTEKLEAAKTTPPKATPEAKPKPKPEAETKPEVRPVLKADTPFSTQGYFLQLGVFKVKSNAQQEHAKAIEAGFNATLLSTNSEFRVRVGPIPQHAQAMEVQAKLKAKGFKPLLLGP